MAAPLARYPTALQLQRMSLQELSERGLLNLSSGSYGALDARTKKFNH